jgi:hypothetical protein
VGVVNFQVSVLKVLSSYPDGLVCHADVKRDLAILATSGPDWAGYSRRLAAAFPCLDVFSTGMVQIYSFGWRLTAKGSIALEMMEEAARNVPNGGAPVSLPFVSEAERPQVPALEVVPAAELVALERPVDRRPLFTVIEGGRSAAA